MFNQTTLIYELLAVAMAYPDDSFKEAQCSALVWHWDPGRHEVDIIADAANVLQAGSYLAPLESGVRLMLLVSFIQFLKQCLDRGLIGQIRPLVLAQLGPRLVISSTRDRGVGTAAHHGRMFRKPDGVRITIWRTSPILDITSLRVTLFVIVNSRGI